MEVSVPIRCGRKIARALLSSGGLVYRVAWQAERKSAWLLLSSWMTCASRSHMVLPCSLWSVLAWEALLALTSPMAEEQVALACQMIWPQVVLASLTTAEQAVLASRIAQEQMALALLIDLAAWDLFWQSSIPSSQMALCLQASVDALVVSRSWRASLAFSQSSIASTRRVTLPVLEAAAIGDAGRDPH